LRQTGRASWGGAVADSGDAVGAIEATTRAGLTQLELAAALAGPSHSSPSSNAASAAST
jgi:hypothetical protein